MSLFKEVEHEMILIKVTPTRDRIEKPEMLIRALHSLNPEESEKGKVVVLDSVYKFSLDKKPTVRIKNKFGYFIVMTNEEVAYLYLTPVKLAEYIKEKIEYAYPKSAVTILSKEESYNYIEKLNNSAVSKPIVTRTTDVLSVNTEGKLGEQFYSIKKNLRKGEMLALVCTMEKINNSTWREIVKSENKRLRYKSKDDLEKEAVKEQDLTVGSIVSGIYYFLDFLTNKINKVGSKNNSERELPNPKGKMSKEKESLPVFRTTINLVANIKTEKISSETISNVFLEFQRYNGDNNFELSNIENRNFNVLKTNNPQNTFILAVKELASLLSLPLSSVMREYAIKYINTNQVDLFGKMIDPRDQLYLAYNYFKNEKQDAFMQEDNSTVGYPYYIVGQQRSGKTTFLLQMVIMHALIGRGLLSVDIEDACKLNNNAIEACNYLRIPYVHYDLTGNKSNTKFLRVGRTIRNVAFTSDEEIPESLDKNKKIDWLKEYAQSNLAICRTILDDKGELSAMEVAYILSASIISKIIKKNCSLREIFSLINNDDRRKEIYEELKEDKYKEFFEGDSTIIDALSRLKRRDYYTDDKEIENITNICNIVDSSRLLDNLFSSSSGHEVDFKEYIKNGTIVFVSLPNHSKKCEINTISMWFYNKLFSASSTFLVSESIPYAIIMDEVKRYGAALEFLKDNIERFSKRKLRCYITMHHAGQLKDTAFKDCLKSDDAHVMLMAGTTESDFKSIYNRIDGKFTYNEDMKEMEDMTKEKLKYALFSLKINGGTGNQCFIGELPQDLSKKENLDKFIKELNKYKKKYIKNIIKEEESNTTLEAAVGDTIKEKNFE